MTCLLTHTAVHTHNARQSTNINIMYMFKQGIRNSLLENLLSYHVWGFKIPHIMHYQLESIYKCLFSVRSRITSVWHLNCLLLCTCYSIAFKTKIVMLMRGHIHLLGVQLSLTPLHIYIILQMNCIIDGPINPVLSYLIYLITSIQIYHLL